MMLQNIVILVLYFFEYEPLKGKNIEINDEFDENRVSFSVLRVSLLFWLFIINVFIEHSSRNKVTMVKIYFNSKMFKNSFIYLLKLF